MALTAPIRSNCASVSASSSSDLLPSSISLLWRGSQTVTEATSGLISLYNQAECVPSSKTTSTLPLNPRKKSQMFSVLVLTFDRLSILPSSFKTTITVICLWTSMPTYLTLLIGRLLDVRNLGHCLLKLTTSGASFHITCGHRGDADQIAAQNQKSRYDDRRITLYTPKETVREILLKDYNARLEHPNASSTDGQIRTMTVPGQTLERDKASGTRSSRQSKSETATGKSTKSVAIK